MSNNDNAKGTKVMTSHDIHLDVDCRPDGAMPEWDAITQGFRPAGSTTCLSPRQPCRASRNRRVTSPRQPYRASRNRRVTNPRQPYRASTQAPSGRHGFRQVVERSGTPVCCGTPVNKTDYQQAPLGAAD